MCRLQASGVLQSDCVCSVCSAAQHPCRGTSDGIAHDDVCGTVLYNIVCGAGAFFQPARACAPLSPKLLRKKCKVRVCSAGASFKPASAAHHCLPRCCHKDPKSECGVQGACTQQSPTLLSQRSKFRLHLQRPAHHCLPRCCHKDPKSECAVQVLPSNLQSACAPLSPKLSHKRYKVSVCSAGASFNPTALKLLDGKNYPPNSKKARNTTHNVVEPFGPPLQFQFQYSQNLRAGGLVWPMQPNICRCMVRAIRKIRHRCSHHYTRRRTAEANS